MTKTVTHLTKKCVKTQSQRQDEIAGGGTEETNQARGAATLPGRQVAYLMTLSACTSTC